MVITKHRDWLLLNQKVIYIECLSFLSVCLCLSVSVFVVSVHMYICMLVCIHVHLYLDYKP